MKSKPKIRAAQWVAVILMGVGISSCSDKLRSVVIPNQLPEVRITSAPIDTTVRCDPDPVRSCYSLILNWVGHDPDGTVDHFLYAVDPPSAAGSDTVWQMTRENEKRLLFRSTEVLPQVPGQFSRVARSHHVFVIKAVDNRGGVGPSVFRAFFSYTEAPTVNILSPRPSALSEPLLTPSVRFTWGGQDRDGVFTTKPVKYKYQLVTASSPVPVSDVLRDPDSLRRFYAPGFVGWDSTSAETTQVQFTNLTPNQSYMFAVVAFDEAGAYSPVFTFNNNILRFRVGFAGTLGPKITFFNEFFEYSYRSGGYCPCPAVEVFIEVPADVRVRMNWSAEPPIGADITGYRWALDIDDVSDETERTNEQTDLRRWSARSLNNTSVTLGPFGGGEEHRLYVEAADNIDLRSLGIVRFQVVRSSLEFPLGIVDDTRLRPDNRDRTTGCAATPLGMWPTAAELDTFLYARGGFPWRCYPPGTVTTPGIFAGYTFDTLNTRLNKNDLTIRLAALGQFRHLIWLVDGPSATNYRSGTHPTEPMTSLRYMTGPSRFNTLGAYIKQGGKVWLVGGGGAMASNASWDDLGNNNPTTTFSITGRNRELAPGRFMYDIPHWQSEFRISDAPVTITRFTGRYRDSASVTRSLKYASLPPRMRKKDDPPTEPLPPLRTSRSDVFRVVFPVEYLQKDNRIVENVSTDPDELDEQSTLDTLYRVTGQSLPRNPQETAHNVLMTYYQGPGLQQGFLFTGFGPWEWRREDCQALVDFVLQRLWGLTRNQGALREAALRAQAFSAESRGGPSKPQTLAPSADPERGAARRAGTGRRERPSSSASRFRN